MIDHLTTELEISRNDFVNKLKEHVDDGGVGFLSDMFDVFSSGKNEFKGKVEYEGFKIKRKKRFFDMNMNLAIAEGKFIQRDQLLIIETEINGFHKMFVPFYIFGIFLYPIILTSFLMTDNLEPNALLLTIPFLFLHAAFMFGIPYFVMRNSARKMKYELEREFFYMTKK